MDAGETGKETVGMKTNIIPARIQPALGQRSGLHSHPCRMPPGSIAQLFNRLASGFWRALPLIPRRTAAALPGAPMAQPLSARAASSSVASAGFSFSREAVFFSQKKQPRTKCGNGFTFLSHELLAVSERLLAVYGDAA
jgi:hypothetical protein